MTYKRNTQACKNLKNNAKVGMVRTDPKTIGIEAVTHKPQGTTSTQYE